MFMTALSATSLQDAQHKDIHEVLAAQKYVEKTPMKLWIKGNSFLPINNKWIPRRPPNCTLQQGVSSNIPVLSGTNTDETTLWGTNQIPESKLRKWLTNYIEDPEPFINAVKEDRGDISAGEIALAISTDHTFRIPAIRMAEARASHGGETWMYEFDWKSKAFNGALGACHALEIPSRLGHSE